MRLLLLIFGLVCTSPLAAQQWRGNEYVGGAALNLVLRGPWIAKSWRRPVPRLILSQTISVSYERFIDQNYGRPDHDFWGDVGSRFAGYMICEGAVAVLRRIF